MALVLKDRVKETTTTTGTGTLTLAGASTGYQSFSTIGNGNTCYYAISSSGSSEWEVGIGTYTSAGTTLARTTILASSNAGAVVTLSAGAKDVYVVYPAGRSVYGDGTTLVAPSGALLPLTSGGTGAASAPAALTNLRGWTTTATAAGTTTLTNASTTQQEFTGATTQTVVLPVTSTLALGWAFEIINQSTGSLTINSSGGNLVGTVTAGTTASIICVLTSGTTAASWDFDIDGFSAQTGTGSVVRATAPSITTLTAAGAFTASATTQAINIGASQTSGATNIDTGNTTGVLTVGGTAGTGIMTLGRSTVSQTTNIQAGATASGSTKTMNIGTAGLSGSTTNINIGSAVVGAVTNIEIDGVFNVGSGIVCNSNAINDNYIIPTGSSGSSVGPVTVASGKSVTVPSGSRWVVL